MNKESFLQESMDEIWNKKDFDKIEKYVNKEYTIHLFLPDHQVLGQMKFNMNTPYSTYFYCKGTVKMLVLKDLNLIILNTGNN